MMDDIKVIGPLPKMDEIEQSMEAVSSKVSEMEWKNSSLDNKEMNVEKSITFVSDELEHQKNGIQTII